MLTFYNSLDTYSFIKFASGLLLIPDKIELLISSSIISDLAYLAFMRRMEVDLILSDLKNNFEFKTLNENIFYMMQKYILLITCVKDYSI